MLRLGIPVIGVVDLERAVRFWSEALDLLPSERTDGWVTLVHADGSGRAMGLQLSASPVERNPRVHVDLFVDSHEEQATAVDHLVALGARLLEWDLYPPDPDFVVLADPDGNAFCVVDLSGSS